MKKVYTLISCPSGCIVREELLFAILFFSVGLLFYIGIEPHFSLPKVAALRLSTLCLLFFWIYRFRRNELRDFPVSILYSGVCLVIWWVVSSFAALHSATALEGLRGRYNGLWNNEIYLLLFFITASLPLSIEKIENILKLFISTLIPAFIYVLAHQFGMEPVGFVGFSFGSTFGNSGTMAAVFGISLPFAAILAIRESRYVKKIFWLVICACFFYVLIYSASKAPLLGLFAVFVIMLIYIIFKGTITFKRLFLFLLLTPLLVLLLLSIGKVDNRKDTTLLCEAVNTSKGLDQLKGVLNRFVYMKDDKSFKGRLLHYKAAVNMIKEYPLFGIGFDSFRLLFPEYKPKDFYLYFRGGAIPSNVHSGYLRMVLTNGVPNLLIYLTFITAILILLLKTHRKISEEKLKLLSFAFMLFIIYYLLLDAFAWLDIALSTFVWVLFGLSVSFCTAIEEKYHNDGKDIQWAR